LRDHSPNFHIHVSVSDLYTPTIGLTILLEEYVDRSWDYINRSQTHEC
jgi:predicted DNA-binding protein with PD1-like motif